MMEDAIEVRMGKYLTGEATTQEKQAFERDLAADPNLHEQFLQFQHIWQQVPASPTAEWNTDAAWNSFSQRNIQASATPARRITIRLSWTVAAAVVIALGAAVFLFKPPAPVTYAFEEFSTVPVELADGSKVFLNEDAKIFVHTFSKKNRRVVLEGEAHFDVAPDASKPFIVEAGSTVTEVVGTAFTIKETQDDTRIYVSHGKVIFKSRENKDLALALTSGEGAFYKDGTLERIVNPSPNYSAWQTKQLSFVNQPLADVVTDLSTYFKREIIIENEGIKACRVTSPRFKEPKIEDVLNSVALVMGATIVMDGDKCIIRGGRNCDQ